VESGLQPNKTMPDPVHGSSLDQATRPRGAPQAPPPPTIMAIATALPRLLMAAAAPAMTWLPLNVVIGSSITTEVTARAHIARARLGLVLRRCPDSREIPPEHMQGGSRCPGPAVEPERARWHDPVLGRWLGLTPERPALCLRRFPGARAAQGGPESGW
jgi:hypothetical protein